MITAGDNSKFGINISDIDKIDKESILGIHCHSGSGIEDINIWNKNLKILLELAGNFPNLEWIDLGGGLGIDIDPLEIDKTLDIDRKELKLFMEPGRYFVSTAGVLVSNVTQIKRKNEINYLGINTGMNSLIRPALYNAYHDIHNISASYNRDKKKYTIVGPICESGDIFGTDRLLPETVMEDCILIENCGAYGYTMSSNYNLREPAEEFIVKI